MEREILHFVIRNCLTITSWFDVWPLKGSPTS